MQLLWIALVCIVMYKSVRHFLLFKELRTIHHETTISFEVFVTFLIIYCIFILGFGLIYFILSLHTVILLDNMSTLGQDYRLLQQLSLSIYFSGVTLLTIGYGDITPVGIGRLIALVQALFGYVLPTAFVLKLVQLNQLKSK